MTVAAVILAATAERAVADILGRPLVRRLAEIAWSGGAVPVVVVAPERDGMVGNSLAGSSAILAEPAPPALGPIGQISRGIEVARRSVSETGAVLIWPARMAWVDPETVTSLLQAHGMDPGRLLRPSWQGRAGWPVLLPMSRVADLAWVPPTAVPDEAMDILVRRGVPQRTIDLGDPGVVIDIETPRDQLPAYEGPATPVAPIPEWGSPAGEHDDAAPLEGPALAPYGPAADPEF
jgi:CTP:molybdopterin cytidylyltransferase MocA